MCFLNDFKFTARTLTSDVKGLEPLGLFLGKGNQGLEVAVFTAARKPISGVLQQAFKNLKAGRGSPVLIVALHGQGASLCGTSGDQPPIFHCADQSQAERLCESVLKCPDRNAAIRFLADSMPSLETALRGVTNEGLLSMHELTHGTRSRPDWSISTEFAKQIIGKSKRELLKALGFRCQRLDNLTDLLSVGEERTALAVLLNEDEVPEIGVGRLRNVSPISYALTKADKEGLSWVVIIQGGRLRLYNTKNIGVGRRGRTETYVECQPSLMASDDIGLLWLLFSADALKNGGTIDSILKESTRFAAGVARKLRDRIYDIVVPEIAMGIVKAQNLNNPSKEAVALTYEMALTVLFRLLFIAYAEDRGLLPYKGNEAYRDRSLKNKAIELAEAASKNTVISLGEHHWAETADLWQAVSCGNKEWGVPAYNGIMFSSDAAVSMAGAAIDGIALPNSFFEVALRGLLLTDNDESLYAPVDFQALSVREFGAIYEGLLESELSLAEQDLTRNRKGTYLPAGDGDAVFVNVGEVYLHDRSGARKSSGSYYTPNFVVEYLLDDALEPALDEHLKRMESLDSVDRAEQFFDFRVADIAMGSGHFLVAAVDRIERRFALWLEKNPIPGIAREMQYLREAAWNELGELANMVVIEDSQLLRRMIARRCIYGVDLNKITVQLARLSIWIHTFVPGLPLSLLDHNLVHGNALVGVASLDEIKKKFDEGAGTLSAVDADNLLGQAAEPLRKLAKLSDASVKDIEAGRALMEEARLKTLETKALCDLITAQPVADDPLLKAFEFQDWERQRGKVQGSAALRLAREILKPLSATHFPIAFPEVFLGRTKGFNVILGNPPWKEVTVEEDSFWARYSPGLGGGAQREQELNKQEFRESRPDLTTEYKQEVRDAEITRNFLVSNYDGMGKGDPDLYKAFCNRFVNLNGAFGSTLGVVLPRSAFSAAGSEHFRRLLLNSYSKLNVNILKNKKSWVFENVGDQYSFVLLSCLKLRAQNGTVELKGPFFSNEDLEKTKNEKGVIVGFTEVKDWNDTLSFPALPDKFSLEIFLQFRKHPRLDHKQNGEWRARPDREMDATNQKHLMDLNSEECPNGFWPVYKGKSFGIWDPEKHTYYAWAEPKNVLSWLYKRRLRANKNIRSVHNEFLREYVEDEQTLSALKPRIVFRDIARATDQRTIICCLVPPNIFLTNKAPFIHLPRGDELDASFLLGVLSSLPFDWYAKRFVELNVNFFILNSLPIPRPKRINPLWQRVVELSGRVACPDDRFADWAAAVGVDCGLLDPDDKQDKIHEVDAVVGHLYGLTELQLIHMFETFHVGWDYQSRLNGVLKHYHAWSGKA